MAAIRDEKSVKMAKYASEPVMSEAEGIHELAF
jgi:hypothetical protein